MAEDNPHHPPIMFRELQPATSKTEELPTEVASPPSQADSSKLSKRKMPITTEACDWCRRKKAKCSGPPCCQNCTLRAIPCTFHFHESKRRVITREDYENLQARVNDLEATVRVFRTGSGDEVAQELQRLRNDPDIMADLDVGGVSQQHDRSLRESSDSWREAWESSSEDPTQSHSSFDTVASRNLHIYHAGNLPTEADVRAAIAALADPAADMFFVMTQTESEALLDGVYSKAVVENNKADICLVCALSALGSHFAFNQVSERVKKSFFKTAWMLIDDCFEINGTHSLRALLCLALFTLVEKRSSVRVMLASGLQIARWMRSSGTISQMDLEKYESFRKLYRSFVLLDSYLATKFAYHSTITPDEMEYVVTSAVEAEHWSVDTYVSNLNTLALLTGNIPNDLRDDTQFGLPVVSRYMQQLEAWHDALPNEMRLAVLTVPQQNDTPDGTWTAILYLHETYLSTVVLLHRGLIPMLLEQRLAGKEWTLNGSSERATECYQRTIITAQQCVRTNTLLAYTTSAVFRRCWLLVCEIFICCSILLADLALNIFTDSNEGVKENLERIGGAIETMTHMRSVDEMVTGFSNTLQPLYDELKELQRARLESPYVRVTDSAAKSLLQRSVHLLQLVNLYESKHLLANAISSTAGLPDWWG